MAEVALADKISNNVEAVYRRGDQLEKRRLMEEREDRTGVMLSRPSARTLTSWDDYGHQPRDGDLSRFSTHETDLGIS
jgi:hypothetical protein